MQQVEVPAPPPEISPDVSELPPPEQNSAEVAVLDDAPVAVVPDGPEGSEEAELPNSTPGIDAEQLKVSVTAYVSTYKGGLVQDWLAQCQKFRTRYATNGCPTGEYVDYAPHAEERASIAGVFETWVTRPATNARISEQLVAESTYLAGLMELPGVMGEIARQRYFLVKDYYCYLNSDMPACGSLTVNGFASSGPASDVVISMNIHLTDLVAVGEGKRHFLRGLFSLSKDGEVEFLDAPRAPPALPFTYPPEWDAPAPLADEDTFEVAAPLFPL